MARGVYDIPVCGMPGQPARMFPQSQGVSNFQRLFRRVEDQRVDKEARGGRAEAGSKEFERAIRMVHASDGSAKPGFHSVQQ